MIAVVVYLAIFFAVFIGSWFGIRLGWAPSGIAGNAGAWTAAYLFTKLTQPLRIAATVVLTTFVGKLWKRNRAGNADIESGAVVPPKTGAL